ncbi:MAG TPA: hypothetical protein VFM88_13660 [Vicinamibacteria bacterium]|nr:hypothetical protein [Vicinamibacteria bacterium]
MRRAAPLAAVAFLLQGGTEAPAPMRGVSWEGGRATSAAALDPLRELGADWISQTPFGWCRSVDDPEIRFAGERGLWGETDAGLVATARWARERGLRTLLKPHLWVRRAWVGELEMQSEEDWRRFFASYEAFILHYARLAEAHGMEALAVGTELPRASRRTADWVRLVARVRAAYRGRLTYCANWHEAEDVGFWSVLDFVGVQAYYPLRVGAARVETIRRAWDPIVNRLEALHDRTGKPIVFTEVGYKSLRGSLAEPWRWGTDGEADYALQRDAYAAMFASVWERPWFGGAFIWKWHPDLGAPTTPPLGRERDFTPQGKPALDVIRSYYRAR